MALITVSHKTSERKFILMMSTAMAGGVGISSRKGNRTGFLRSPATHPVVVLLSKVGNDADEVYASSAR